MRAPRTLLVNVASDASLCRKGLPVEGAEDAVTRSTYLFAFQVSHRVVNELEVCGL